MVSVLFADLVGFTTLAEDRDPEDVRELFEDYYAAARRVVARHGGVVDKFIGDAVMAVWGAPVAREDDAERAVRASLELLSTVGAMALDGEPLHVRVGLATGEAASTPGPEGRSVLAGDVVNTASRLQSVAPPGTALVDSATEGATDHSIAYADAGEHELKGKSRAVHAWQPLRVTAGMRGAALGGAAVQAPLVGRDEPLRQLKDAFHATVDDGTAHRAAVVGLPGIGKSRLALEFERYIDGLADDVLWHRGRSIAYGDGVAYWALSEMLRMRARIADDDAPELALRKLSDTLTHYADDDEHRWLQPKLAPLLGLPGTATPDRQELFAAWRRFFERLAATAPTVLVFDELQWADSDLLDFIDYLLEWSHEFPLFVLTLARPEQEAERPLAQEQANVTRIQLGPLPRQGMDELLAALASGLPEEVRERIRSDADGVPLYAVETLRTLLAQGAVTRDDQAYAVTRPIEDVRVPETLHALIAARIDGLPAVQRRVLQDAAILGESFDQEHLATISGLPHSEVQASLPELLAKEFLVVDSDPLSPTQGQYAFVQGLLRKITYETFSKRDRQQRHLDVARSLEEAAGDNEGTVEIIAAHYLDAYQATARDDIRDSVLQALTRAAERAASLPAPAAAQRYYEHAVELASDPGEQGTLHEHAGLMALRRAKLQAAREHFQAATGLFEDAGSPRSAARMAFHLSDIAGLQGQTHDGVALLTHAFDVLADEHDETFALVARRLALQELFTGRRAEAARHIEDALQTAEALHAPAILSDALRTKGEILAMAGRVEESIALAQQALASALDAGNTDQALYAHYALAADLLQVDRYSDAIEHATAALDLARTLGDRVALHTCLANLLYPWYLTGQWDDVLRTELSSSSVSSSQFDSGCFCVARVTAHRGDVKTALRVLSTASALRSSDELQDRAYFAAAHALVLGVAGCYVEALAEGTRAFEAAGALGADECVQEGFIAAVEAAMKLERWDTVRDLLDRADELPAGQTTGYLRAHVTRFRGHEASHRLAAADADDAFTAAADAFRKLGVPFALAVTLTDRAAWLAAGDERRLITPLLSEARAIFHRLGAQPWLQRLEHIEQPAGATISGRPRS